MNRKQLKESQITYADYEGERARILYRKRFRRVLANTLTTLLVVVSLAILISSFWIPVLQVSSTSMEPTLEEGDIVTAVKSSDFVKGDVIAFYYNNKILVKRVIAGPGDWVDIDSKGTVLVNGKALDEPYVLDKDPGQTDILFPYQVPEERWFVLGDHRSTSLDSRSEAIGLVAKEQVVGRITARIWPFNSIEIF